MEDAMCQQDHLGERITDIEVLTRHRLNGRVFEGVSQKVYSWGTRVRLQRRVDIYGFR